MILYQILRVLVKAIITLYWRTSFEGLRNVPKDEPFILAPVHRSNLDFALVSGVTRRRLCYMAKDSVWKYKLLGRILESVGAFPVRRGTADREALRRCRAVIERGEPLVMFPEGTRREGPVVQDIFEGPAYLAAHTGAPIVPVGIGGSGRAMPRGAYIPRPRKIHIVVGPPIRPEQLAEGQRPSRRSVRELNDRLRDEVQRLFDEAQKRAGVKRLLPKPESAPDER